MSSTSTSPKPVQLGLCCLNTVLRAQKPAVFASRTVRQETFNTQGIEHVKTKIEQNLRDVITMIEWNERNGIRVMRLSSEMFPHLSNPNIKPYTIDFARPLLKQIGDTARQYGHRLTFHPGQFNVVGTPDKKIFEKTSRDLQCHADILDAMEMDQDSVMVVHGGGVYGNKYKTIMRWCEQFHELPENVRRRLVLENCEKNFSIEDCLEVSNAINIPVVFDTHHYACYQKLHPDDQMQPAETYITRILETWHKRGIKPKFHVSEQGPGRIGHHSDYIQIIPEYLLSIPDLYCVDVDVMIEAKMKEQAIFHLYKRYPELNCSNATGDGDSGDNNTTQKPPSAEWIKKHAIGCECCEGDDDAIMELIKF